MNFQDKNLIPSKYIYLVMSFVCLILLFVSVVFGDRFSVLKTISSAVVTPMQSGVNELGTKLYDTVIDKKTKKKLEKENKKLKEELEIARTELKQHEQDSYEIKRLQELLKLQENYPDYEMIGARVIATDSTNWFHTFIIDKGTSDGVEVGCNILSENGLVGIVTEAGMNYAKVRSIIDENSSVSASVSGTDTLCTVTGDLKLINDGYIRVGYINKQDSIEEGAELVTSHISDKFLPGLLIGYITDVKVDSNNLTQSAKCIPVVDFRNLREVMVILTLKKDYKITSDHQTIYDNISNVSKDVDDNSSTTEAEKQEDTSEASTTTEASTQTSTQEDNGNNEDVEE